MKQVDIIKVVGLFGFTTSTSLVPCFGHKAAAIGNMKWDMWLKFNAGR